MYQIGTVAQKAGVQSRATYDFVWGGFVGQRVSFASNGGTTDGYLARPEQGGPPVVPVVVVQEWWGLVPHIEGIADRFAAEGFVALAPDLCHGNSTKSPDEADRLMMSLEIGRAARDLDGAIRYLQGVPGVKGGGKVGTIGFCMGGALSLYAACRNPAVGACVVFYGTHPNVKPDLAALQAPVLGIYGRRDKTTTPAAVTDLDRKLDALGKRHEFHTYDAGHAFFNDTRPEVYAPEAAADAWAKTVAFLRRELNG
jgi:carboxymethylenebutenolidase